MTKNTELAVNDTETNLTVLPPARPVNATSVAMLHQHAAAMAVAYELAERLVRTDLVPARYRNKPEDATAAVLYGAELGLNPIQSLQNVFSVNGTPAIYARTMAALLKARGYKFRTPVKTDTVVEVHGWEPGRDPDTTAPDEIARWTIEDAQRAGYVSNKKYVSEPKAMLLAKALAEICRHLAPDVLLGISYSVEEFDYTTSSPSAPRSRPAPISVDEVLAPAAPKPEPRHDEPDSLAADTDTDPAETPDLFDNPPDDDEPITAAQLKKLHTLLGKEGLADRDAGLAWLSAAVGRDITSSKNLSKTEGIKVIETLENDRNTDG